MRAGRMRAAGRLVLAILAMAHLTSCGGFEGETDGPLIEEFIFHSQLPDDPWTLIFVFAFSDPDGDLSEGDAEFYAGAATSPLKVPLSDVFLANDLALGATRGTASVALNLDAEVQDGQQVNIALVLVDGNGQRSNRYTATLEFGVGPAPESKR